MSHIHPLESNFLLLAVIAALLSAGSGPAMGGQDKNQPPARGTGQYHAWLMHEVRHELVLIPWLSVFDNLQYRVDGDNVILSGQVTQPFVKDEAQNAVKGIEGVGQITNNIEVLPLSPMDDQIRRAEYRAIYSFPSLERYSMMSLASIHIVVKGGHVTLEGVVANQADKDVADIRAKTVPNVFSVTDNLQVENSGGQKGGQ